MAIIFPIEHLLSVLLLKTDQVVILRLPSQFEISLAHVSNWSDRLDIFISITISMFLWTRKPGSWERSVIQSMSLLNALKYKIDRNILLTRNNMVEFHRPSVLLTGISGEVPVHPHLSNSFISSSNLPQNPIESCRKCCHKLLKSIK